MKTRTYTISSSDFPFPAEQLDSILASDPQLKEGVFFDIETTGFSASHDALYLIGCCRYEGRNWSLRQWMAENESPSEQRQILQEFLNDIQDATTLISYNGRTFDLPFLQKKCASLHLRAELSAFQHRDLYQEIKELRSPLHLNSLKLKSVEEFLGIKREDPFTGGELIAVFQSYEQNPSPDLLETLLLHNFEDIQDMLFVLPILSYKQILNGGYTFLQAREVKQKGKETPSSILLSMHFQNPLPKSLPDRFLSLNSFLQQQQTKPLDQQLDPILLHIDEKNMDLTLPVLQTELKFFYKNYRDYYYLPIEDYAIHKSVASFVDKNYRQKATPATCYTKKAGVFLPQIEEIYSPAFQFQLKDSLSWFAYTPTVFTDESKVLRLIHSFLSFFNKSDGFCF